MPARRSRSANEYRRREPVREPYDVVLIVCEGEKTEPKYFKELRAAHSLSNANVIVAPPEHGNDPLSIARYAEHQLERSSDYNRVYCVFDRNGHATYAAALQKIKDSPHGKSGHLIAIPSVPCFEVWVLLHYEYTSAPFNAVGGKSSCDQVIKKVMGHCYKYHKGFAGVFEELVDRTDAAVTHAKRLETHNRETNSENPATDVHHLVTYLRGLRSP